MSQVLAISAPSARSTPSGVRVAATLRGPGGNTELYYLVRTVADTVRDASSSTSPVSPLEPGTLVGTDATPFLAACLLPAMRRGWAVHAAAPVAARVLEALPRIQRILAEWDSRYRPVEVTAPPARAQGAGAPAARGAGCFFSGGVDSFYTVLERRAQLTGLVFISGFDIRLDEVALRDRTRAALGRAAGRLGLPLVEVETNVRHFVDAHADWELAHGPVLAAVAHVLAPRFHTLVVPASHSDESLFPWGSHPDLDPLWSSDTLAIVHDDTTPSRVQKVERLARSDAALETLRVCWRNPDGVYNCGRCEKCLRTMVNLLAAGALDRCTTFATTLDVRRLRRLRLGGDANALSFLEENVRALERRGTHPEVLAALRAARRAPNWSSALSRRVRRLVGRR